MNAIPPKRAKISFYTNGAAYRVVLDPPVGTVGMIQTSDDRNVDKIWRITDANYRWETYMTCDTWQDKEWRLMKEDGIDASLIRQIIAALHYNQNNPIFQEPEKKELSSIIEATRPTWQRNPDEPIPTPIPHPSLTKEGN